MLGPCRKKVDLAAPGTGILSTIPGDGYEAYDGTSMATPIVTGAAVLLKAVALRQGPLYPPWLVNDVFVGS